MPCPLQNRSVLPFTIVKHSNRTIIFSDNLNYTNTFFSIDHDLDSEDS